MTDPRPEGAIETAQATGRHRPSTRRPRPPRRRRGRRAAVWLLLIAAAVAAGWFLYQRGQQGPEVPETWLEAAPETSAGDRAGDRAVVLVFPEWDATGFVTEQQQIPSRDRPGEDLLSLMSLLCAGPRISGAVSPLPAGTRALAAFHDAGDHSVVLDFSRELVTGHPGGTAAESATLTSILRTVALNFPQTRSCVILIEGAQVETLAGHLNLARPFDPQRWL